MSTGRRVICLGDVMTDVLARLPGPLARGSDTPARVQMRQGGSAANTAAWLAVAGVPVEFVGRVGDDVAGVTAREALVNVSVRVRVTTDPRRATGTCIVLVDQSGERTMIPDAGANAALTPDDLPPDVFGRNAHLHVSGYALFGGARAAAERAVALARTAGMTVSVGAASSVPLREFGAARFFDLIGTDVLVFANSDEAAVLSGYGDPQQAARALADLTGRAAITCGRDGALWCDSGEAPVYEPVTGTEVADSTGAGDAFTAGVLAAWLAGARSQHVLRAGHALAARAVTTVGARPAAPATD